METALLEIGLAPDCVHKDNREKKYYLMKRFVRAAIKRSQAGYDLGTDVVAFFNETPFNFIVMVDGEARFDDVADIFCTPEFTTDERRQVIMNLTICDKAKMECEAAARGYQINRTPVFAVITF